MAPVGRAPSTRAPNDVLGALLSLAGDDAFARRCLLETLLPCLMRLAGKYPSAGEDPDVVCSLLLTPSPQVDIP